MALSWVIRRCLPIGLLVGISGCTIERTPHLYPANAAASATGVLEAQFVGHGNLHGTAQLTMPDGEALQGEYSIVSGGSVSFGSIFSTVYGRGGSLSGTGISGGLAMDASGQGQASFYGTRGTSIQCEFLNNNMTGHGYGACKSSKGAIYRLLY
jgi:hypothetical protein